MENATNELMKRLLFILHRGLVQTRNLALAQGQKQIADLADALEILPGIIEHGDESKWELVRFVLEDYQRKYPAGAYDYLAHLEKDEIPAHF